MRTIILKQTPFSFFPRPLVPFFPRQVLHRVNKKKRWGITPHLFFPVASLAFLHFQLFYNTNNIQRVRIYDKPPAQVCYNLVRVKTLIYVKISFPGGIFQFDFQLIYPFF